MKCLRSKLLNSLKLDNFLETVTVNLTANMKWLNRKTTINAQSLLDDFKKSFILELWSDQVLNQIENYKISNTLILYPEYFKTILVLIKKLNKFKLKLHNKKQKIRNKILYLLEEGLSLNDTDLNVISSPKKQKITDDLIPLFRVKLV